MIYDILVYRVYRSTQSITYIGDSLTFSTDWLARLPRGCPSWLLSDRSLILATVWHWPLIGWPSRLVAEVNECKWWSISEWVRKTIKATGVSYSCWDYNKILKQTETVTKAWCKHQPAGEFCVSPNLQVDHVDYSLFFTKVLWVFLSHGWNR